MTVTVDNQDIITVEVTNTDVTTVVVDTIESSAIVTDGGDNITIEYQGVIGGAGGGEQALDAVTIQSISSMNSLKLHEINADGGDADDVELAIIYGGTRLTTTFYDTLDGGSA